MKVMVLVGAVVGWAKGRSGGNGLSGVLYCRSTVGAQQHCLMLLISRATLLQLITSKTDADCRGAAEKDNKLNWNAMNLRKRSKCYLLILL